MGSISNPFMPYDIPYDYIIARIDMVDIDRFSSNTYDISSQLNSLRTVYIATLKKHIKVAFSSFDFIS